MRVSTINTLLLVFLFGVTLVTIIFGSDFWLRLFWCSSTILFYGIYKQYVSNKYTTLELLFAFSLVGNVFTLFYEQWYFTELALLSFGGAYTSLMIYFYKRRRMLNIDKSFRPYFIVAFVINVILVTLILTEFSVYFENPLMLPILIFYFVLILALAGMAFLHFNSVATIQSLYLLGFILGIILADILRFLDYYYYSSTSLQYGALLLYSGGYFLGYKRMLVYANKKSEHYIFSETVEIKEE